MIICGRPPILIKVTNVETGQAQALPLLFLPLFSADDSFCYQ